MDDPAHDPMPEEKPKIQVGWRFSGSVFHPSSSSLLLRCLLQSRDPLRLALRPAECHPAAAAGPVPLHDRPGAGPDGGHGDRQALCLQPARGGAHSGPPELALSQGHVRDPRHRRAGATNQLDVMGNRIERSAVINPTLGTFTSLQYQHSSKREIKERTAILILLIIYVICMYICICLYRYLLIAGFLFL